MAIFKNIDFENITHLIASFCTILMFIISYTLPVLPHSQTNISISKTPQGPVAVYVEGGAHISVTNTTCTGMAECVHAENTSNLTVKDTHSRSL